MSSALDSLFPLYALNITLQCIAPISHLRHFHQPALTAWLRHLLAEINDYEQHITLDAVESGRSDYAVGDAYQLTLFVLHGNDELLAYLLNQFNGLPHNAPGQDTQFPFRDNLRLRTIQDLFTQRIVQHSSDLSPYTLDYLHRETQLWQTVATCRLCWNSPARLLLPAEQRHYEKGELRYCRHSAQLNNTLLYERLHDSFAHLLRYRLPNLPPRHSIAAPPLHHVDIFWVNYAYRNTDNGYDKPMGGMLGEIVLDSHAFTTQQWHHWILGQYLGIGQRRAFGWGRYRLETLEGHYTKHVARRPSLLSQVAESKNLLTAYHALDDLSKEEIDPDAEPPEQRLLRLAEKLTQGDYQIPPLREYPLAKPDGSQRHLLIAPFFDRVLQRAVAQILTPPLDSMMYQGSVGYRRGRSRHDAKEMIEIAYREGYRWVFESDIHDFFDLLAWSRVALRLRALFGTDPIVDRVMAWIQAPVQQDSQQIERTRGLPQGSPLSPVLSNLMLDDFDSDLSAAGLRLVRFTDDFIILCQTQAQAQSIAAQAETALAEVGLTMEPQKTQIRSFQQGFRFLGYLFVNGLALDVGGEKPVTVMSDTTPEAMNTSAAIEIGQYGQLDELGTLVFVTGAPSLITTEHERLQLQRVSDKDAEATVEYSLPWSLTQAVVLIGNQHHITTPALRIAMTHGVAVHFADSGGHYQGSAWNPLSGVAESELWLAQLAWLGKAENAFSAARLLVRSRIKHQREVLRLRNVKHQFDEILMTLERLAAQAMQVADLESLRGVEGSAAQHYFQAIAKLVPPAFGFETRQRRPPPDPFNALLSLGYSMLFAHVDTVIRVNGLLPHRGVYHQPHGAHLVLASDLMEPFRHLIERVALNMLIHKYLSPEDFIVTTDNGCRLTATARRRYFGALSERFEQPFLGQGLEESQPLHPHLQWQVRQLVLWIQGKVPEFTAWQMR